MNRTLWKSLGGTLLAALLATGCATTSSTTTKKKPVETDEGDAVETPKNTGTKNANTGKRPNAVEAGNAVAAPTEVMPQINSKAKLAFEDALKALDAAKKSGTWDFATLERKFQQAADADSALAEADYNLGVLAEKQGKTKEAVDHYKTALRKRPTLKQAAENLGVIAQNSGDEATATATYQDILNNFPEDASSRARLAELKRRHGETDQAMQLAREALFRDPKTLQAYKTMMQIYFEQKQFSMARLIALRASKIEAADPEILYTLGLINLAEKEPAKARVNFKATVEARPDFMPAVYQLAKMALAVEDYQSAEAHLRKILQVDGKNVEALVDLGVSYKGMGQLDKAMATYDAAQKLNPDLPAIYLNRGVIIGLKGEPEKAIAMFNQYLKMRSDVPADHPVHGLIKEQEAAIKQREDDKKAAEEAKKMEEEMKKQEAAAAEEEKKKKEEELKKAQGEAKGNLAKDAAAAEGNPGEPSKDPKKGDVKDPKKADPKDAKKADPKDAKKDEPKKGAPPPAAAPTPPAPKAEKKTSGDEPSDGL